MPVSTRSRLFSICVFMVSIEFIHSLHTKLSQDSPYPDTPEPPSSFTRSRKLPGPDHPNILYIIADDFGYGDVGYHNNKMITPNIDAFAKEGVRLESFYTQHVCSATRGSILTGRYVHRFGFQHFNPPKAGGGVGAVPLSEKLLPEYLKDAGYSTHLIGKWHAGMIKEAYLPQHRGFDTHFGFYEGGMKYYNHTIGPESTIHIDDLHYAVAGGEQMCIPFFKGIYDLDLFTAAAVNVIDMHNTRASSLFLVLSYHSVHAPNESPAEFYDMYPYETDATRRVMCGMVSAMDKAVGITINKWRSKGDAFWKNSVIIFHSDNGGSVEIGAMNFPLRGSKLTLFEGGMRVNAFVLSPLIAYPGRIETGLLHVTDILPMLAGRFAGQDLEKGKALDGMDVWDTISYGVPSPRTEIMHLIDPMGNADLSEGGPQLFGCEINGDFYGRPGRCELSAAIRNRNWKLIVGMYANCTLYASNFTRVCGRYKYNDDSEPNLDVDSLAYIQGRDNNKLAVALFDIESDPFELVNVAKEHLDVIDSLMQRIYASWNSEWMDPQWPPSQVCDTPDRSCDHRFDLYNASNLKKGCANPFVPDNLEDWGETKILSVGHAETIRQILSADWE